MRPVPTTTEAQHLWNETPHRRYLCAACAHRDHVDSCPCSAKGCACLKWRLTSYARILPAVFGAY